MPSLWSLHLLTCLLAGQAWSQSLEASTCHIIQGQGGGASGGQPSITTYCHPAVQCNTTLLASLNTEQPIRIPSNNTGCADVGGFASQTICDGNQWFVTEGSGGTSTYICLCGQDIPNCPTNSQTLSADGYYTTDASGAEYTSLSYSDPAATSASGRNAFDLVTVTSSIMSSAPASSTQSSSSEVAPTTSSSSVASQPQKTGAAEGQLVPSTLVPLSFALCLVYGSLAGLL